MSEYRDEIMNVIKRCYIKIHNKNLPIYAVPTKDLRDYTTTEKDFKKNVSKHPLDSHRITDEDLLKETPVEKMTRAYSELSTADDFDEKVKIRGKQLTAET